MDDLRNRIIQSIVENQHTQSQEIARELGQPVETINQTLETLSNEGWFQIRNDSAPNLKLTGISPALESQLNPKNGEDKIEEDDLEGLELPESLKKMSQTLYPEI